MERKIWEREGSQNIRTQSKRTNWLKWLIFDLLCCLDMDLYENDIVFIGLFLSILLSAHFFSSSCRKQIRNQISKSNCATTFQRRHLIQLTDFFRKWISIVKCHAVHQIRQSILNSETDHGTGRGAFGGGKARGPRIPLFVFKNINYSFPRFLFNHNKKLIQIFFIVSEKNW